VGIIPNSLKILEASGVTSKLLEEGIKIFHGLVHLNQKKVLDIEFEGKTKPYDFILALPQDRTEIILSEKLKEFGGEISYSKELVNFKNEHGKIIATLKSGEEIEADYLIGADGIKSQVRSLSGIEYPGIDLDETWSIADVDAKNWPHKNAISIYRVKGGKAIIIVPIAKNRYRLVSNTPKALDTLPIPLEVININREGTFNISVRQAESYQKGNIFLAGDAAHCHSPVGGRGMNLGIADAVQLAELIINDQTDNYTKIRHAAGKEVVQGSEKMRKLVTDVHKEFMLKTTLEMASLIKPLRNVAAKRMLGI
jgi:2-polyprenyl-6-methoxyphenol hydroxylase-like FAD-dependent oxidoreductase